MTDEPNASCECHVEPPASKRPPTQRQIARAQKRRSKQRRRFWVRPRRLWRAKAAKRTTYSPWTESLMYVIVHHTADPGPRRGDVRRYLREIQRFHQETRGWNDIAYNYLIDPEGIVWEGRPFGVVGAHAPGYNTRGIGVCFMGTYTSKEPSPLQVDAFYDLLRRLEARGVRITDTYPHRRVYATSCPGDGVMEALDL